MTNISRRSSWDDILDRADLRRQPAAARADDSSTGQVFDPLARDGSYAFDGRSAIYPSCVGSFGADD